jgi:hypothetical protein
MPVNTHTKHIEQLSKLQRAVLLIANDVGTPQFLLFCVILSALPGVFPSTMNLVQFISSGFLQLVLLPILAIQGRSSSKHDEIMAEERYKKEVKRDRELSEISKQLKEIQEKIK